MTDAPPTPARLARDLAQLQHDIHIHLAQALHDGWQRPTPAAHSNYSRPREGAPSAVTCGEFDFYIMRNIKGQLYGVETVITTTQYRRALAALEPLQEAAVLDWLSKCARPYPAMYEQHYAAFAALAAALGLEAHSLRPAPPRPQTLRELLTPSGRKRTRV